MPRELVESSCGSGFKYQPRCDLTHKVSVFYATQLTHQWQVIHRRPLRFLYVILLIIFCRDQSILFPHPYMEADMAENAMTEKEFRTLRRVIKPFSRLNVFVYKLTGGRVMGTLTGRPVMLVTMEGVKSGKTRTIPLMYVPYNDGVIVVASQGGAPRSPVWYKNLIANPDIIVQYKNHTMNLRARQVEDAEKAEVWPVCVEHYHEYDDYQKRTDRNIPVFVCEPRKVSPT